MSVRNRAVQTGAYHTERYRKQTQPDSYLCCNTSKMNKAKLPTHVEIDSMRYDIVKDSVILLEQLRTIDKKRLKDKVCHLDNEIISQVNKALYISLEMGNSLAGRK